ncbi:MAG: response regulator [Anaerolineae bacterium]|nr:response regulator [Anaerolineae bacterium]
MSRRSKIYSYQPHLLYLNYAVIKRFVVIVVPLLLLLILGGYYVYTLEIRDKKAKIEQQQLQLINTQQLTIDSTLQSAVSDLLLLSEGSALQAVLDSRRPSGMSNQRLLEIYFSFIAKRGIYDQIQVLDTTGTEVARVNYNYGHPTFTPPNRLAKDNDPSFKATILLAQNEISISPLQLNTKNGQFERPLKPVIHLGTPVFDQKGQKLGIVKLTLLGDTILNGLDRNAEVGQSEIMLLNAQGFYLKAPDPKDEWGFMTAWSIVESKRIQTFENDFNDAWATIQSEETGQIYTADGLFTFQTIRPFHDGLFREVEGIFTPKLITDDYHWKYVSRVSPDHLKNELSPLQTLFILIMGLFSGGVIVISWIIAQNSVMREVSEQKASMLSQAIETSPAIAVITDTKNCIQYVNPKFTEVTGYTVAEVIGLNVVQLSGVSAEQAREKIEAIKEKGVWHGTHKIRKKNGEMYWELAAISAIKNANNKIIHYARIAVDVTDNKKMEEELRQAKETAEAMSRAKSEFLANMSHEIRTPMNGVIGMTELALDTPLTGEQRDYLTTVQVSAEALLKLLNDILDLSKIEAGRLELETVEFNIWETVEKTIDILVPRAFNNKLEFLFNIDPDVPISVKGDPFRIRQVLVNLIGNAIKFTDQGEIVVTVQKQNEDNKTITLLCAVTDTGIGIPADKQAKIFESFAQADSSITRQFGGTGLGLTISHQLVQMMGGEMWVESQEGQGSTFFFTLTLVKQANAQALDLLPNVGTLQGRRVMIIDDNTTNRHIVQKTLQAFGCLTDEAANGREGIKQICHALSVGRPFDLLLLDVVMEQVNGFEVLQSIRQWPELNSLPVIMLTSVDNLSCLNDNQNLGWSGYLTKPLKQLDLLEAMVKALDKSGAQPPSVALLPPPSEALPTAPALNILLTEDNEINRQVAVGILKQAGHQVTIAENGHQALERLEVNGSFDLILMDIQMPVMDGLQATKTIRHNPRWRHIPIVALTAHAMNGDRENFLELGMNDYLSKPVRTKELVTVIDRTLSASKPIEAASKSKQNIHIPRLFNDKVLLEALGGDTALFEELMTKFIDQLHRQILEIEAALAAGDMKQLGQIAHTLKGTAAMMSAERLQEAASRLEMIYRKGSIDQASEALADLQDAQIKFQMHIETRWPHLSLELQPG